MIKSYSAPLNTCIIYTCLITMIFQMTSMSLQYLYLILFMEQRNLFASTRDIIQAEIARSSKLVFSNLKVKVNQNRNSRRRSRFLFVFFFFFCFVLFCFVFSSRGTIEKKKSQLKSFLISHKNGFVSLQMFNTHIE